MKRLIITLALATGALGSCTFDFAAREVKLPIPPIEFPGIEVDLSQWTSSEQITEVLEGFGVDEETLNEVEAALGFELDIDAAAQALADAGYSTEILNDGLLDLIIPSIEAQLESELAASLPEDTTVDLDLSALSSMEIDLADFEASFEAALYSTEIGITASTLVSLGEVTGSDSGVDSIPEEIESFYVSEAALRTLTVSESARIDEINASLDAGGLDSSETASLMLELEEILGDESKVDACQDSSQARLTFVHALDVWVQENIVDTDTSSYEFASYELDSSEWDSTEVCGMPIWVNQEVNILQLLRDGNDLKLSMSFRATLPRDTVQMGGYFKIGAEGNLDLLALIEKLRESSAP